MNRVKKQKIKRMACNVAQIRHNTNLLRDVENIENDLRKYGFTKEHFSEMKKDCNIIDYIRHILILRDRILDNE